MSKSERFVLHIGGHEVPVTLHRELRKSVRASLRSSGAILRMPLFLSKAQQAHQMQWFEEWVGKQLQKNGGLPGKPKAQRIYQNGDTIQIGDRVYQLDILEDMRKTHSGKMLPNGLIRLNLSNAVNGAQKQHAIQRLISRLVSEDHLPEISRRVHELNYLYFRKPIQGIFLKLNQRTWGSCSTKGNINLSSRLLFAPTDVLDYVIIHELAHLVEMNHSDRFWKLVEEAMPEYREKEKWLKQHGAMLQF